MSGYIVCGAWGAMQMCKGDEQLTWADDERPVTVFKTRRAAQGAITRSNNWRRKNGYATHPNVGPDFQRVFRLEE